MNEERKDKYSGEEVGEMLRDLPREKASPTFTADVLRRARLETSEDRPSRWMSIFSGSPRRDG